jgi:hypothetical protein
VVVWSKAGDLVALLRRKVLACLPFGVLAAAQQQQPQLPPPRDNTEDEVRLPNGKLQRDEILKSEYDKSLQDAIDLQRLSNELRTDLEKTTPFVMSISMIKKTEEIEKIARRIRGRLKHT